MPPRCPECGRFLSNAFVQGLLAEPGACPRCATTLTADQFHGADALLQAPEPLAESVRPPDLPPESVRPSADRDVLAGWDQPASVEADRSGRAGGGAVAGVPVREVAGVVGAGIAGGLLGGLLGALLSRRRTLLAVIGTLFGAGLAVLASQRQGSGGSASDDGSLQML